MERDVAIRIDGFLMNIRSGLAAVADYIRNNVDVAERKDFIQLIGKSMAQTAEISNKLHVMHPNIIPAEFRNEENKSRKSSQ